MVTDMTMNGYEFKTTFWMDFTIADQFGYDAIKDTYERAFNAWKDNYIYLVELCLVLNWKLWQHYKAKRETFACLYNELWGKTDEYALLNLKGEELDYYYHVTD